MLRRYYFHLALLVAVLGLSAGLLNAQQDSSIQRSRKYKVPPSAARIEVVVLRDINGKPIENAAVIFHPIEGDKDKGIMELKTNEDGKAVIDVIPVGDTVRLQVIARGFQTEGQDFKVDKSDLSFEIRLKRPGEQYSVYQTGHTQSSSMTNTTSKPKDAETTAPADSSKPATPSK
ncbi:carboxypeptidase-like regulatory domain-containing protein [Telmatobacter bradus]|uniref:carboxypeptidase-like regulatory domain-containing protein n=1 Tax=Telmatobacter bradus TaxID=474953 RepID=UPI003B42CC75